MKTIYVLVTAFFVGSAFAQNTTHMIEFNADSIVQGLVSLDKSKTKGQDADTDTQMNLRLNYAYSLITLPALQLGGRLNYLKDTVAGRGDAEDYNFEVGVIYNFMMQGTDLANSMYVSLYGGYGWANTYGSRHVKDEIFTSTFAVGKRFSMKRWGMENFVYSPEVALENVNSTTGSALEYTQNIQFRFLQFSVFF